MTDTSRRRFLRDGALAIGSLGLNSSALLALSACSTRTKPAVAVSGYGPLRPVPDARTGLPLLMLPDGFRYVSFAWAGDELSDGYLSPGAADGMGVVVDKQGLVTLVRNHELRGSGGAIGAQSTAYDVTGGGCTSLCFDRRSEQLVKSWVSLGGTLNNCAGGVTPWGSWLSCEEGPYSPNQQRRFGASARMAGWRVDRAEKEHGWVFEVPAEGVSEARPIKAMGQCFHEAVAIDPHSGIAYLTEDRSPDAGFYRYMPDQPGELAAGGRLQMMQVIGQKDLSAGIPLGRQYDVSWVDIENPEKGHNDGRHDSRGLVDQGLRAGASSFIALEGCAYHEGQVVFTSKLGGVAKAGQVFRYDPAGETLQLIFEATAHEVISGPDNIIFSPRGNLVICEDQVRRGEPGQRILSLTDAGDYFYLCRINPQIAGRENEIELAAEMRRAEWAGVCFSDDGQWMFANVYSPGLTVAITGPWESHLA